MMLPPGNTTIQVLCYLNGVAIMSCKAEVLSYSRTSIKISLTGTDINDNLSGNINSLPLATWNFGKMTDLTQFWTLMQNAAQGVLPEFEAPVLLRSNRLDYSQDIDHVITTPKSSYPTGEPMTDTRAYWNSRYANFINYVQNYTDTNKNNPWEKSGTPYLIPVVHLNYILSLIPELTISSDYAEYLSKIGVVAPYKKNALISDIAHGGLDKDEKGDYVLSLADALPKIEISSFIKNILNILSATIYLDNGKMTIIANNDIINATDIIDWTDKVADDYDCDISNGYKYVAGYQNLNDDAEAKEIDMSQVQIVDTYQEIYNFRATPNLDKNKNYIFQIRSSGDIYSISFNHTIEGHAEFSLLRRGGSTNKSSSETDNDDDTTYNAEVKINLVKSIPSQFFLFDYFSWDSVLMAAITDIPEVGAEPSEDITIGMLHNRQLVERGVTLTRYGMVVEGKWLVEKSCPSLLLNEESHLYQQFHKGLAEFLAQPKTEYSVLLNITAIDISTLRIWKKRLIYNQIFYIKTLEVKTNTSTEAIAAQGVFIRG